MHDCAPQVVELSSRLSAVSQDKARLESRNSVLEKVMCMDQQLCASLAIATQHFSDNSSCSRVIEGRVAARQVVKLKDEYISNLESRASADGDVDERPPMNRSLHAALWWDAALASEPAWG